MTGKSGKTSASAVSAALRRAGFLPVTGTMREGLKVRSTFYGARVFADIDGRGAAKRMSEDAEQALTGAGYVVRRIGDDSFEVQKES